MGITPHPPRQGCRHPLPEVSPATSRRRRSKSPLLFIQGPFTPQLLEIHSSSGSSGFGYSTTSSLQFRRTVSASDLPQCTLPDSLQPFSSQSSPAQQSVSVSGTCPVDERRFSNLPPAENAFDGIAYSAGHTSDADIEIQDTSNSYPSSWEEKEQTTAIAAGPAVWWAERTAGTCTRTAVDPKVLLSILSESLLLPLSKTPHTPTYGTPEEACLRTTSPEGMPYRTLMRTPTEEFLGPLWQAGDTSPIKVRLPGPIMSTQESRCDACEGPSVGRVIRLIPCGHIICSVCFSTSLSAVSVTHGKSRCTACMVRVCSFQPFRHESKIRAVKAKLDIHRGISVLANSDSNERKASGAVMRIDNIAWDITPAIVESFLPPGTLASIPVPIHILLNRFDGRTKDYLYIEVASQEAARRVMKSCQNTFMPGGALAGGRKRPVTVSPVNVAELIAELRPRSAVELNGLLSLCQAAVSTPPCLDPVLGHTTSFVAPNGVAHFVKSRHGPFYALMSIMSKLNGKQSPAYWDVFHVASGAIAALAISISRYSTETHPIVSEDPTDADILERLSHLFRLTFELTDRAA